MAIYKKLLAFQMLDITIKKDGSNPHCKSKYATLNEVLEKIKKPLNEMQILVLQTPEKEGLRTVLMDMEDDSKVECFMPYVEVSTAQKLGSNNTYNRRYSLVTLLGLEDEDDDGNKASEPTVRVAPKSAPKAQIDPFKAALKAISETTTPEEMSKLAEKINASAKFTEDQKAELMDSLQARSELV